MAIGDAKKGRTNRKRLVNATGLRSSSRDAVMPRSGEARSSSKGEGECESKLSTCFDLSQEKRPLSVLAFADILAGQVQRRSGKR